MKIVRAKIENFMRVEVVEITPEGDVVEITGANGQGKSSVLDGIMFALGGAKVAPQQAVHRGASKARVVLDLGDLTVERIRGEGADKLVVKSKDGGVHPKAQGLLDGLVGGLAFDPMGFEQLDGKRQREVLLGILGVDLDGFERRRKAVFERRASTGRELKSAEARLAAMAPVPEGTPAEEVSVADLAAELETAHARRRANDAMRAEEPRLLAQIRAAEGESDAAELAVQVAQEALERAQERYRAIRSKISGLAVELQEGKAVREALQDPDTYEIQKRMAAADGVNRNVRTAQERAALAAEVERIAALVADDTAILDGIDQEKVAALAAAPMPVPGLDVGPDGVLFEGLPLGQASFARRVRVCTAIGAALNPELRVALVRNGNDLDATSLAAFYEECAAHGLQAWVERIVASQANAIEIVAGRVKGDGEEVSDEA